MAIRTIQTLINIGTSKGVTLPAKDLKYENIQTGDELEIIVRKRKPSEDTTNDEVLESARKILREYQQDFKNLADR